MMNLFCFAGGFCCGGNGSSSLDPNIRESVNNEQRFSVRSRDNSVNIDNDDFMIWTVSKAIYIFTS
jgi:hypothetical protein